MITTSRKTLATALSTGCLALGALGTCGALGAPDAAAQTAPVAVTADPLFGALGGKPGIARLMDDFVPRVIKDARIGGFFKDTNAAELQKQLADQFCATAGGGCVYEGATMKKAHADMHIAKGDFNRMVELLQVSMDKTGIAFADQNRLLARLAPMHRDVIEVR